MNEDLTPHSTRPPTYKIYSTIIMIIWLFRGNMINPLPSYLNMHQAAVYHFTFSLPLLNRLLSVDVAHTELNRFIYI